MHAPCPTATTVRRPWALLGLLGTLALLSACGGAMPAPHRSTDVAPANDPRAPTAPIGPEGADFAALAVVVRLDAAGTDGQRARSAFGVHPTLDTAERPHLVWPLRLDRSGFHQSMRALAAGRWPSAVHLRTESFLQAGFEWLPLPAPLAAPLAARPAVQAVAWPSPHRPGYHLLHVTATGGSPHAGPLRAVVILPGGGPVDAAARHRVQRGLGHLATALGRGDELMVVGAGPEGVVALLPPTPATDRARLGRALEAWRPDAPTPALALGQAIKGASPFRGATGLAVIFAGLPSDDQSQSLEMMGEFTRSTANLPGGASGWAVVDLATHAPDPTAGDPATRLAAALGAARFDAETGTELRAVMGTAVPEALRPALSQARLELRFDAPQVQRHRPLGFERLRTPGSGGPGGWALERSGAVPAGGALVALFEVKLGALRGAEAPWVEIALYGGLGDAPVQRLALVATHAADAVPLPARLSAWAAAFGEKLAGGWWSRAVQWSTLGAELDALRAAAGDSPILAAVAQGVLVARRLANEGAQARQASETMDDFDHLPVQVRAADGPR